MLRCQAYKFCAGDHKRVRLKDSFNMGVISSTLHSGDVMLLCVNISQKIEFEIKI